MPRCSSATRLLPSSFSGPTQIEDAQITADAPTLADGSAIDLNVDGQAPHAHVLMKLPFLVGSANGQVPAGAVISSAFIQINCTNPGQAMSVYRLTQDWVEDEATWNERAAGVPWTVAGADGAGSNAGAAVTGNCTAAGQRTIDISTIRSGMDQRVAELRRRVYRLRHGRHRLRQQRIGQSLRC